MLPVDDILSFQEIELQVNQLLDGSAEGEPLSALECALINLAVHASPATLDLGATEHYASQALEAGATAEQVHEVLLLVSGLGVHTLLVGSPRIGQMLKDAQHSSMTCPLDDERQGLLAKYVGDDPYWKSMEKEFPGFLDSLLRLSPIGFEAFFNYCAVPWKTGALRALTKELISLAVDATPSHRFLPGLRLHVRNALKLGATRTVILQALDLAGRSTFHRGVR
ncbi:MULTISPECIES: carboxymuconolactone decarboxylase family protein [Pseudomonas]|uniref:carboxymuconolactone decarboxylase family protein n=1 Tax=Pseudomonas TaxID=286 RepID=UPI0015BB120A|nr:MULTISPECIES: carboxymuconolactone decarboxylase family protein [Pseudomonas]MDH4549896.1 carboxymuconolactone decarboxylase family protein [Pseudomonas sp. BN607]MDH4846094.1 carboxymuconolactone decarboxylase family protein [Pseudomonas sp. BN605]MDH4858766.1 carboxymuconolactone decarboxylase family protein [Pseudomonas sp. BN505]NWL08045.1 hypothetical protein [Pseudomonas hunanensis]